jgi:hypothetical protein
LTLCLFALLRGQIPLRLADIRVTQPVLNRANVHAAPQCPRRKRVPEFVQPEVRFVIPARFTMAEIGQQV